MNQIKQVQNIHWNDGTLGVKIPIVCPFPFKAEKIGNSIEIFPVAQLDWYAHYRNMDNHIKTKPMNPQQKITDLEKRQEEIAKELAELKKEMKPKELTLNQLIATWGDGTIEITTSNNSIAKLKAIRDMIAVADHLNGDWKPDWNDDKQLKFGLTSSDMILCSTKGTGGICCFKSSELAEQAISILGEEKIKIALS